MFCNSTKNLKLAFSINKNMDMPSVQKLLQNLQYLVNIYSRSIFFCVSLLCIKEEIDSRIQFGSLMPQLNSCLHCLNNKWHNGFKTFFSSIFSELEREINLRTIQSVITFYILWYYVIQVKSPLKWLGKTGPIASYLPIQFWMDPNASPSES